VMAMHQALLRPLEAEPRPVGTRLASPPRREWLELVRHWQGGATGPVWFLADPRRTDLALIDPQARRDAETFTWGVTSMSLLGGMRPADVRWYRLGEPGWFATEGWSLTPETAGMARLMGKGPHLAPIHASVRRRAEPALLLVGGRHLGGTGDPPVSFTVALDGRQLDTWSQPPGFFTRSMPIPAGALDGTGRYADLTVASTPASGVAPVPTAIEQFDLQSPGVTMWAFGRGFFEPELDDQRARSWRWMSDEAVIEVPQTADDVTLVLGGESPLRYFPAASTLEVWSGEARLGRIELAGDFVVRLGVLASRLQAGGNALRLTTSQTFSPAERGGSEDRRRLGLRLFTVALEGGLPAR
jgi:hypothetical protein